MQHTTWRAAQERRIRLLAKDIRDGGPTLRPLLARVDLEAPATTPAQRAFGRAAVKRFSGRWWLKPWEVRGEPLTWEGCIISREQFQRIRAKLCTEHEEV